MIARWKVICLSIKANLRDLIAVTGLVILLKMDSNNQFCGPHNLENWLLTLRKIIEQLLYAMSSFGHHFKAISKSKLELHSENAEFGLKWATFCPVWPWNLMDDLEKTIGHLLYATSSVVNRFIAIGEFKFELQSGNAQVGSKSTVFCPVWPRNLTDDLEKQQGTFSMLRQALCIIS